MSSRARRLVPGSTAVTAFPWGGQASASPRNNPFSDDSGGQDAHLAALEREAFGKGFAQGESAGAEAAAQRGEAMLHHLARTLDELNGIRAEMVRQTERQMVQLALAIARRVVLREVALDPDLLLETVRGALDRLGDTGRVTVRLHPDDYAAIDSARLGQVASSSVTVTADPRLNRGACHVESDMGLIDAGIDAQLRELERALLGKDETSPEDGHRREPAEQPAHV